MKPHVCATRGKTKMQALVALMRKLLHAIFGIFKHHLPYEGSKLFPQPTPQEVTCP
jgi:transposase